jgi:hypothetical protein
MAATRNGPSLGLREQIPPDQSCRCECNCLCLCCSYGKHECHTGSQILDPFGIAVDRELLPFRRQGEFPRRDAVRIFSCESKLRRLSSPLEQLFSFAYLPFHSRDSHSTGVKLPKMVPSVSRMTIRVFARPSQRRWNS